MENLTKNLKIARIVLYFLIALFLLLQFVDRIFIYFAVGSAVLVLINLAIIQIFKYKFLKDKIKDGYDLYLADCYKDGYISKKQYQSKTQDLYPEYLKMFKKDKFASMALFVLYFGLAVSFLVYLIREII
ncbi:MAG: hypothetical protein PHQ62_02020 [Clostridia bacterium]|nr:hypothetical protein [Clostridia bacterium]